MRTIHKSKEPSSLTQYRHTPGATYGALPTEAKRELRDALIAEQRGLCCYCMGRVSQEGGRCRIEHWHSQTDYEEEQLSYGNLLAACHGSEGTAHSHCDVHKGSQRISRNPARPEHAVESLIRYLGDGTIQSSDPEFERELNEVLNLNAPILRKNRRSVMDGFLSGLGKGRIPAERWRRMLPQWSGEGSTGPLPEYAMVVVYFISKKLAR